MTAEDGDGAATPPPNGSGDASAADDGGDGAADGGGVDAEDLEGLREDLEALRSEVEERTLRRDEVERDLRRYVRRRVRRGHARGWGPYLVLLYGTAMTLGAFVELSGGWAILAMVVIWLSTLGLYTLMIVVGVGLSLTALPRRAVDRVRNR